MRTATDRQLRNTLSSSKYALPVLNLVHSYRLQPDPKPSFRSQEKHLIFPAKSPPLPCDQEPQHDIDLTEDEPRGEDEREGEVVIKAEPVDVELPLFTPASPTPTPSPALHDHQPLPHQHHSDPHGDAEDEEEEKPDVKLGFDAQEAQENAKPVLKVSYKGYSIFGKTLIVMYVPPLSLSRVSHPSLDPVLI